MELIYPDFLSPKWVTNINILMPSPTANMCQWLQTSILSQALRQVIPNLGLTLLEQALGEPDQDECNKLELSSKDPLPFIRQVLIGTPDCAYLYCRVVIPYKLYKQEQETFDSLGSRFIGETLLYHQSHVHRSTFDYAVLNPTHLLYQRAKKYFLDININFHLYTRRSLFYLPILPLLITEVFIHALPSR